MAGWLTGRRTTGRCASADGGARKSGAKPARRNASSRSIGLALSATCWAAGLAQLFRGQGIGGGQQGIHRREMIGDMAKRHARLGCDLAGGQSGIAFALQAAQGGCGKVALAVGRFLARFGVHGAFGLPIGFVRGFDQKGNRVVGADHGDGFWVYSECHGRTGADRGDQHPARRYPHAGLHAGGHGGDGQGDAARKRARDRGRYPAGQHLSSDAAPDGRADCPAGRLAQVHELGSADSDRLRRLSGDVAGGPAQADRGGRAVFSPISTGPSICCRPSAAWKSKSCWGRTS